MYLLRTVPAAFALVIVVSLSACSDSQSKSPAVTDSIRRSLDDAGLKDVGVRQDRDKGVVTLSGNVLSDSDKAKAEAIAKSFAANQVVANQIAVRPEGAESVAKKIDSDLDEATEKNIDAELTRNKWQHSVKYEVKNGVVTLTGSVNSQAKRTSVENTIKNLPNVKQVVNELQVKNLKATSTKP